jgi:aspartate carbamoyltransferase
MGDKVVSKSGLLRKAVTFQQEFVDKLPPNTKFFHPLPRDARHPTLPFWLDKTEHNGWDQQSQNGYFTRIVLLAMLGGLPGLQSAGSQPARTSRATSEPLMPTSPDIATMKSRFSLSGFAGDFVNEIVLESPEEQPDRSEMGLVSISAGIIMDNLGRGCDVEQIWPLMGMVRSVLGLNCLGGMGVYRQKDTGAAVGFLALPNFDVEKLDRLPLKKLAAMTPGSTLSIVIDGAVQKRFELQVPPRIYNIPEISCKNLACISHPSNGQREVSAYFLRVEAFDLDGSWSFSCKYCEHVHSFWQIWDYRYYQTGQDLTQFTGKFKEI